MGAMVADTNPSSPIVIRDWRLALSMLIALIGLVFYIGSVKNAADESQREIQELKSRPTIDPGAFENYQKAVEQRLDRIERKIDNWDNRKKGLG
jgi:hypothetical protein